MLHVFCLVVALDDRTVSRDACWYDIDRCIYFARRIKQQSPRRFKTYCLPEFIEAGSRKVYQ
jgi:hypothetical protein